MTAHAPNDVCARAHILLAITTILAMTGMSRARPDPFPCNVRARTAAGWVCGLARWAEHGAVYASFRGVPYAKQPLGELRFKELEPPEPWDHLYDARTEGPVCEQTDVIYGRTVQPQGSSEACIHANIHVPIGALPGSGQRLVRELQPPPQTGFEESDPVEERGLPILVFIHGGGFMCGSGDADLHGPEYLVSKQVIVITFNYRLNVYGFLSLNSSEVPGNAGLRDMVTLLRWVRQNARAFGGDPDNVTLMGQSAGAVAAHLLTLSKATEGLFKRAFLMSGNGITTFVSTSPAFAQYLSTVFLSLVNINETDPAEIHRRLIELPAEKLTEANRILLEKFGLSTFMPTVEAEFPGVTRVLDDDPEALLAKGRRKNIPLVIGFTDSECQVFRHRLEDIDIASTITNNSVTTVPPSFIYKTPPDSLPQLVKKISAKYYNGSTTTDKFMDYCTDAYFKYPALKTASLRAERGGAPVYLYEFTYDPDRSVLRSALDLDYKGAAHVEDLTFVFRVNSQLGTHNSFPPRDNDDYMKDWMTTFVTNFMKCSEPVCGDASAWPAVTSQLQYQRISGPFYQTSNLTDHQRDILDFFDSLRT